MFLERAQRCAWKHRSEAARPTTRSHCGHCGTSLGSRQSRQPSLAVGSIRHPAPPADLPVALAGDKYGAAEVAQHGDILARTLWGEKARQLNAYDVMREADERRGSPSAAGLDRVLGDRKVVALLDELPRYLRAARRQRVGVGGGNLAGWRADATPV